MMHLKAAFLVLFCMVSLDIHAYTYITCTDGSPLDFGSGHMTFDYANNLFESEKTAMDTGHARLTEFSNSSITIGNRNDTSYATGNGENDIFYDSSVGTAMCAYTYYNSPSCYVVEADMVYGNQTWKTTDNSQHLPYTSGRSVTGTAVHEGGHCIGMAHTNNLYNMMGAEYSHVTRNGTNAYYGPGEDLSDGLIDLHGKRSVTDGYRDLGITVMRYDGVSGEYSTHKFGVLTDSTGTTTLPTAGSYEGQTKYQVTAGDTIRMELTEENNGELNTEYPNIGYYLSWNSTISTIDTLLGTNTSTYLGRGSPYETTRNVTIPSDTAAGNNFLGAIIDYDNLIGEVTAGNNVAYYPVSVVVIPDLITISPSVNDSTLTYGQSFTIYATAKNQGLSDAPSTTMRYYRSSNATISTGDVQLGTDPVTALASGATSAESLGATTTFTDGTHYVGACVDTVTGESPTSNQCSTSVQITVTSSDLVVISPRVSDSTLTPGQSFTIYATAKNQGTGSSSSTTMRYYRSTNSTITTFDTELGTDYVTGLAPTGTSAESRGTTAPTADGTYWVGACVDAVSNESVTNNQCSTGVQITVVLPQMFNDVPPTYWAYDYVQTLGYTGVSNGCGAGNYCPEGLVKRSEMAVFLERAMNGGPFTPPAPTGLIFNDVPTSHWAAGYIEQLFHDGVTNGCGAGNYCPEDKVTRAHMAIFLLRSEHGGGYYPPAGTGTMFTDVPASHPEGAWIEQLANEGITDGCGENIYCPDKKVTRAEMAVFLVRTHNL